MTTLNFSHHHSYPYYWTDEQVRTLLANFETSTLDEIAQLLGRSRSSAKNKIHNLRVAGTISGPKKYAGKPAICKYCGATFTPTRSNQRYCSKRHLRLWAIGHFRSQRPEMMRIYNKRNHQRLRETALLHYGGSQPHCACCGEATKEFLAIDHVNNDGAQHRRTFKGEIYQWLKNNSYPAGFQILCHNCNFAKARYHGCPHQRRPKGNRVAKTAPDPHENGEMRILSEGVAVDHNS